MITPCNVNTSRSDLIMGKSGRDTDRVEITETNLLLDNFFWLLSRASCTFRLIKRNEIMN